MAQGNLIFISGGVRSGKSSFAESYAAQVAESKDKNLYYLATSLSFDDEMTKRIKHHQATRGKSIYNWQTIEASKDISEAVYKEHEDSVILLDCLTVWLSNEFYQKGITEETLVNSEKWNEVKQHVMNEIKNLRARTDTLVIVSNDIFHEGIHTSAYVNLYSQMLGELHQYIVSEANQAFAIESTVPILMKQS